MFSKWAVEVCFVSDKDAVCTRERGFIELWRALYRLLMLIRTNFFRGETECR